GYRCDRHQFLLSMRPVSKMRKGPVQGLGVRLREILSQPKKTYKFDKSTIPTKAPMVARNAFI
ncbi:MAG TPA: hypothetical protein VH619_10620, partial [Verrucomicrobiae bacterium]|nr:hypothetical protein [Verrucomicrobiae bacterium]